MGYMAHHTVIVTADDYVLDEQYLPDVDGFRANLPDEWQQLVTGPHQAIVNGYVTWMFLPDGSQEGWDTSDEGDEYRQQFADLFAIRHEDESTPFDVVVVRFGGDEPEKMHVEDPRRDWRTIVYENGRRIARRIIPGEIAAPGELGSGSGQQRTS